MKSSLAGGLVLALLLIPDTAHTAPAQGTTGTAGPDVFNGADSQRNVFRARGGADRLNGGARGDLLCGEAGADQRRQRRGQALRRLLPRGEAVEGR